MNRYTIVQVNVSEGQKDKIKRAMQAGSNVNIRLTHGDLSGEDKLALTQAQINKIRKAYHNGTGITIKMSKTQLEHNTKVEGGFIGPLLGFLASTVAPFLLKTALPALATGALSGLASTGVSKAFGSGTLYIKKNGNVLKMTPMGQGLYLKPYSGEGLQGVGEGLFRKTGNGFVNGSGLILGQNNPISNALSNIPLLGPLVSMIF